MVQRAVQGGGDRLDFDSGPQSQPEVWLPRVQRLLREQAELAQGLARLSERASGELLSDDHEGFDRTLDDRDGLLREMSVLAEELRAPMATFSVLVASLTDEQARQIRAMVAELNELLDAVSAADERVRHDLERRRSELGHELAREAEQWGRARAASRVYGGGVSGASQGRDVEG